MAYKIGNILKEGRRKKGYSQDRLARLLGCDFSTISRWERGKIVPRADKLARVAHLLDIQIEDLFDR